MFVGAVERLVTLCGWIPCDANGQDVRIRSARAFDGSEVQLDALDGILIKLQTPAGDGIERRHGEITFGVFQVFIATKKLRPLIAFFFGKDGACDDGSWIRILGRLWDHIAGKELLRAGFCEVAENQNLRFIAEQALRGGLDVVGNGGFGRLGGSLRGGFLRRVVATACQE